MTEPLFLLDSNIIIYILRDASCLAAQQMQRCAVGTVATSAIVHGEVMRGVGVREPLQRPVAERFFTLVPVLPFDMAAASRYAELPFKRGSFDRLIAAHALSLGLVLVTNNQADFADIPDLRMENWTI
ncbi:type II toxin-antitoxin system VapC family toxin [Sphingobium sp. H39-3-25]|uniref:type II toxin-antitoxin system VapC family toxin n=1 Tax=Sphingobium arseniciresistens TaxID=3030834 RepID=UPI0023B97291|nr:type II toxin-antitoxin system VapC family toxin [Sphingobium arseniciresistens]